MTQPGIDPNDIIPESVQLQIAEVRIPPSASPPRTLTSHAQSRGATLREWRVRLGGDEGSIPDPLGRHHAVSLLPWKEHEPDGTYLAIGFTFRRRSLIGTTRNG